MSSRIEVSLKDDPTYRVVIEQPLKGDSRVCRNEFTLSVSEAQDLMNSLESILDETGQS